MSVKPLTEEPRAGQEQVNSPGTEIGKTSKKDATIKITSPKLEHSKHCSVSDTLLKVEQIEKPNSSSRTGAGALLVDGVTKGDIDVTGGQKCNTDTPSPLKWRLIGPYQDLRLSRCRRIYARTGRKDDLALFYQNGRFYAMEAWCSHMGMCTFLYFFIGQPQL